MGLTISLAYLLLLDSHNRELSQLVMFSEVDAVFELVTSDD